MTTQEAQVPALKAGAAQDIKLTAQGAGIVGLALQAQVD